MAIVEPGPAHGLADEKTAETGAEAIVRVLARLGIRHVFGIPGGNVIPLYDALFASRAVRAVLTRHEVGAGHAAIGYSLATGRIGVAIATSGPGATNLVTAIADAHADSVPLLFITGQVFSDLAGTDAFQEADIIGITYSITKHSIRVERAVEIAGAIEDGYRIATSGRPGPVLIEITKDAQQQRTYPLDHRTAATPTVQAARRAPRRQLLVAATMIRAATRPILLVGGGVVRSGAASAVRAFVEGTGIPIVRTIAATGVLETHPLALGVCGPGGSPSAARALEDADLVIAVGVRFHRPAQGTPALLSSTTQLVHIDIDAAEIGKVRRADVAIVGDARSVLTDLTRLPVPQADHRAADLRSVPNDAAPTVLREPSAIVKTAARVIASIRAHSNSESTFTVGSGHYQHLAAGGLRLERPGAFITPGGFGTPGFALPTAMGVKLARPSAASWAFDSDAGFLASHRELATCATENIPIKVVVFPDEEDQSTDISAIAAAYDALTMRISDDSQIEAAVERASIENHRSVVVQVSAARTHKA